MEPDGALHSSVLTPAQVLARVDRMVAVGRLTEEEGARLRVAAHSGGLEDELRKIRLRHARARLDRDASSGRVSEEQAQRLRERLHDGADPRIVLGLGAPHADTAVEADDQGLETGDRHG